jgi:hypothetical protein
MLRKIFGTAAIALGLGASAAFAGPTTEWSAPVSNGNGCPIGSSSVTIAGDEIAWVFDEFYFDLVNPESASRFCRLSAKAKIARGIYLAKLSQVLSYAGIKSTWGSSMKVATVSRFFGYTLPVIQDNYPNGTPFDSPFKELKGSTDFLVIAPPSWWCGTHRPEGLFQSTLSANGQVLPGGGSMSFAGQGFNVKFEATAGWLACAP